MLFSYTTTVSINKALCESNSVGLITLHLLKIISAADIFSYFFWQNYFVIYPFIVPFFREGIRKVCSILSSFIFIFFNLFLIKAIWEIVINVHLNKLENALTVCLMPFASFCCISSKVKMRKKCNTLHSISDFYVFVLVGMPEYEKIISRFYQNKILHHLVSPWIIRLNKCLVGDSHSLDSGSLCALFIFSLYTISFSFTTHKIRRCSDIQTM